MLTYVHCSFAGYECLLGRSAVSLLTHSYVFLYQCKYNSSFVLISYMRMCRSAFLMCICFNIFLQALANALGEERIELMVDALLKGDLSLAL